MARPARLSRCHRARAGWRRGAHVWRLRMAVAVDAHLVDRSPRAARFGARSGSRSTLWSRMPLSTIATSVRRSAASYVTAHADSIGPPHPDAQEEGTDPHAKRGSMSAAVAVLSVEDGRSPRARHPRGRSVRSRPDEERRGARKSDSLASTPRPPLRRGRLRRRRAPASPPQRLRARARAPRRRRRTRRRARRRRRRGATGRRPIARRDGAVGGVVPRRRALTRLHRPHPHP